MSQVRCARCGNDAAALPNAPLPGEIGASVLERTCAGCWKEWLGAQVILINENRLSPAVPEHFDALVEQMTVFLKLDA